MPVLEARPWVDPLPVSEPSPDHGTSLLEACAGQHDAFQSRGEAPATPAEEKATESPWSRPLARPAAWSPFIPQQQTCGDCNSFQTRGKGHDPLQRPLHRGRYLAQGPPLSDEAVRGRSRCATMQPTACCWPVPARLHALKGSARSVWALTCGVKVASENRHRWKQQVSCLRRTSQFGSRHKCLTNMPGARELPGSSGVHFNPSCLEAYQPSRQSSV
jgi:hypothetical protein